MRSMELSSTISLDFSIKSPRISLQPFGTLISELRIVSLNSSLACSFFNCWWTLPIGWLPFLTSFSKSSGCSLSIFFSALKCTGWKSNFLFMKMDWFSSFKDLRCSSLLVIAFSSNPHCKNWEEFLIYNAIIEKDKGGVRLESNKHYVIVCICSWSRSLYFKRNTLLLLYFTGFVIR